MKLTVTDARMDGEWLCLKAAEPALARAFVLDRKPRPYECELRERREKRSLDANAYYWQLCGELAPSGRSRRTFTGGISATLATTASTA